MSFFLMFCSFFMFFHRIHSEQFTQSITIQLKLFFFSCFTNYILFNGIFKLVFNIRNTCLYLIINFLSNLKIYSKHILIFNYFLHMSDFGHGCEFLKTIRALFCQISRSDINNKSYICWYWHQFFFFVCLWVSL